MKCHAYGRVSLLGNPSDIYGGKCISFTFNRSAEVCVIDSNELRIVGNGDVERSLEYNGKHDLVKACLKRTGFGREKLNIEYFSDIPVGSGLAGSSAIVIALMRVLNDKYNLKWDGYKIAEEALRVETEELGISAGFQDRYVISFSGVCFMDFSGKEYMRDSDGYGLVEKLNVSEIPFFLCLGDKPKNSATVHNPLRAKFLEGGLDSSRIKSGMDRIADLAFYGRDFLLKGKWDGLGALMNRNTELREELFPHRLKDKEMINRAMELGAFGAKVAGSGGAVVVLSENREVFEEMSRDYPVFKPRIVG